MYYSLGTANCDDEKMGNSHGELHANQRGDGILDIDDGDTMLHLYLARIGFSIPQATALINNPPNFDDLQLLLKRHLLSVPFENMDQHRHPSDGDEAPEIPRRTGSALPSLDVAQSLEKIVTRGRGGFCFEVNFAFCWLLRSLGYGARLALADVGCEQVTPTHVVILVDGVGKRRDASSEGGGEGEGAPAPVLVDVGYPGGCELALRVPADPRAGEGEAVSDPHGDRFSFAPDDETERFDVALRRARATDPTRANNEPMYRFRLRDDLDYDAAEFAAGLERVLTVSEFFTKKRICFLGTETGHVTLGTDYIKWVERGLEVKRKNLQSETEWRNALKQYFDIDLSI